MPKKIHNGDNVTNDEPASGKSIPGDTCSTDSNEC